MSRSIKTEKLYKAYIEKVGLDSCPICARDKKSSSFVEEGSFFKILKNDFPYETWDKQRVEDHLMIAPKNHVNTLADMSPEAKVEFVNFIDMYERAGYNFYARTQQNATRSVAHQHTHLIKTYGEPSKFEFSLQTPRIKVFL